MADDGLLIEAEALLAKLRRRGLRIATAESCTGGLISAVLTAVPGSSDVFDRGFVTYSNEAKTQMLGVPAELIDRLGAVSGPVAEAMVQGALQHARRFDDSGADVAVAVTGIAGPGGGSAEKPVGLVYVAATSLVNGTCGPIYLDENRFGDMDRDGVRRSTVIAAIQAVERVLAGK
ncbi:MAG: CinA family protein [Alphaproteobacteria bacterium]|nr:CinA family protein [Alphaproteobacteria bacterium]